jgi:hypothetical protein
MVGENLTEIEVFHVYFANPGLFNPGNINIQRSLSRLCVFLEIIIARLISSVYSTADDISNFLILVRFGFGVNSANSG